MVIKKNIYLILLLFLVVACSEKNEEVVEKIDFFDQWALIVNYTAASCYNCGAWGAPLVHELEKQDRVVAICAQSLSDPMYTPIMLSFKKDRESGGEIPAFWVGDVKTVDEESTRNAVNSIKTKHPAAGLEISYNIIDTSMNVIIKTTFSVASEGVFYLSVFLLEDGIDGSYFSGMYRQIGTLHSYPNDDFTHDFVLRSSSIGSEAYGEKIIEQPAKDEVISSEYVFSIKAYPKENIYPVAVLWEYIPDGGKPYYKYVNAVK